MKKVKFCLIGAGRAGMVNAKNFEFNIAESEVVAVVDFDLEVAREAAEELNTNDYYTNFEEALIKSDFNAVCIGCLLYTSDAADEEDSVDLGGRRIIKKKKKNK